MGIHPVNLFHDIEHVAAAIEDGSAYLLYIHCERVTPEILAEHLDDISNKLSTMNKEILKTLEEEGNTEYLKYDKDGEAYTTFPLPTALVASHCMILLAEIDFQRFPEMRGCYGLQKLNSLELFQWLGVTMRRIDKQCKLMENPNSDIDLELDEFTGDLYLNLFSFYEPFSPTDKSKLYNKLNTKDVDFMDNITELDSETSSGDYNE